MIVFELFVRARVSFLVFTFSSPHLVYKDGLWHAASSLLKQNSVGAILCHQDAATD